MVSRFNRNGVCMSVTIDDKMIVGMVERGQTMSREQVEAKGPVGFDNRR